MRKVSVVIPTNNEINNGYIKPILQRLLSFGKNVEVIVVDNNSDDGTVDLIQQHSSIRLVNLPKSSRAGRINKGVEVSKGDMVLINHPRSLITKQGIQDLIDFKGDVGWGAFTHKFDSEHWLLKLTSIYSNKVRGDMFNIYYLDHCLFASRELCAKVFPIKDVEIFEDTRLCKLLVEHTKPIRIRAESVTSAVRFKQNGFFKQSIMNQVLKIQYFLNTDDKKMNKKYEKNLNLNNNP